jgi:molybdate transport system substrate-binding protein
MMLRVSLLTAATLALSACAGRPNPAEKLTVAAAANLTGVFDEIGRAFTAKTGLGVVFSYGSTAELAQQIDNGAPFDLFAAADAEHVDALVKSGKLQAGSRSIYALGQLALWVPRGGGSSIRELKDLTREQVRFIAVAQPELAPYGQAAMDVLKSSGLWPAVQSKIVYANSVSLAKQLAASGNADATFTAYSLVLHEPAGVLKIDPHLYRPIEQALAIVTMSSHLKQAQEFREFLLGGQGQAILAKSGYLTPSNRR